MSYIKEFIHKKRIINPLRIGDAIGLCILRYLFLYLFSFLCLLFFIPQTALMFIVNIVGYYLLITLVLKFYSKYDYNDWQINKTNFSLNIYGVVLLFFIGYLLLNNLTVLQIARMFVSGSENYKGLQSSIISSNPLLAIIVVWIIAPICEEIVFRGIVLEGLLKKYSYKKAIFFSALLFSISHKNMPQFVNTFFFGLLISYLYYKTHSLKLCIFAHILNNSLGSILIHFIILIPYLNGPLGFILGLLILLSSYILFIKGKSKYSNHTESA